jgi:hypothetical protein
MIFLVLGVALVLMETSALIFGGRGVGREPGLVELLLPLVVFAVGAWRWPREWKPVGLFAVALAATQNAERLPLGRLPTLLALAIGVYLAVYGWRTRQTPRAGRNKLGMVPLVVAWAVIALLVLWVIPFWGR